MISGAGWATNIVLPTIPFSLSSVLSMGFKILHVYWRDPLALGLAALTFVLLEFQGIGLIPVVLVLGPIAMALYWPRQQGHG